MKSNLAQEVSKLGEELQGNRRLQFGLLLIVAIFFGYLYSVLSDRIEAQHTALQTARAELSKVREIARSDATRKRVSEGGLLMRQTLDRRLWRVPSAAVAQAQLSEWLGQGLKQFALSRLTVSQAVVVPSKVSGVGGGDLAEPVEGSLVEMKSSVSFAYDPALLAEVLAFLEGGERFAVIDSLMVSTREKRVDMSVRGVALIDKTAQVKSTERLAADKNEKGVDAEVATQSAPVVKKADETKPKEVNEIVWQ